jgi:hypothetical protein
VARTRIRRRTREMCGVRAAVGVSHTGECPKWDRIFSINLPNNGEKEEEEEREIEIERDWGGY